MLLDHSTAALDSEMAEFDLDPELTPIELTYDGDVDTIIVSDIHLGSDVSRSRRLLQLLRGHTYRRLILNGDVFDDLNFRRMSKQDWKFLSYVRKMSSPRRGIEVVWVVGNHDGGVSEVLSHLLGVPVHEEFLFEIHGVRMLAIHGHQFDEWITEHVTVTAIASWIYLMIQKLDPEHRASRWVKRKSKKWLRLSEKIAHDAARYGTRHSAQAVFCGHTHHATEQEIHGVRYFNSGCWTDKPSQYITIDHAGSITVRECH
jgi:UDP-2,3-diacylglucosamine pyrophosphatase LpxH